MQPFRIALCQLRAHDIERAEENLQAILEALDDAGEAGAQLVVLPECSYPAYYLRDNAPWERAEVRDYFEFLSLLSHAAERHGYWLAAGVARCTDSRELRNSAMVFGPDGEPRGNYDKSFLWHFDSDWFTPGREFAVWDMGFAKVGALICADGRMPEIARSLALNGAEVILDLTAWVSSGRNPDVLTNPQVEYFMPVRALENGVWIAAADKWGEEAGSIVYTGRSCVIDPRGETVAMAPSQGSTVLIHDLEPVRTELVPRRLQLYRRLTAATESLPVVAAMDEPVVPSALNRRVTVVPSNGSFDAAAVAARYRELRAQTTDLVVFGGVDGPEGWQVGLSELEATVKDVGGAMVVGVATTGCSAHQSAVLITPEETIEHAASHGRGIQRGESESPVVSTPAGNVALMCGDEGLVPEVARSLMLAGADIVAWPAFAEGPLHEAVVRTRADENRVYVAAAWPSGAMVAAPNGAQLAVTPAGSDVAMTAPVSIAVSRAKDMAPGTNVVLNRIPEAYSALV